MGSQLTAVRHNRIYPKDSMKNQRIEYPVYLMQELPHKRVQWFMIEDPEKYYAVTESAGKGKKLDDGIRVLSGISNVAILMKWRGRAHYKTCRQVDFICALQRVISKIQPTPLKFVKQL